MDDYTRKALYFQLIVMTVAVSAFVSAVDYFLGINNLFFTILLAWMFYKIVKKEARPLSVQAVGGFALYNHQGRPCLMLGNSKGEADGVWQICLGHPQSKGYVLLTCKNGEFQLAADTGNDSDWGVLSAKSITRMVELGILQKPGDDDGDDSPKNPGPSGLRQAQPKKSWVDAVLYFLSA